MAERSEFGKSELPSAEATVSKESYQLMLIDD
jgi:hypothetical protein